MTTTESRKLIENKAKFREYNERVEKSLADLKHIAADHGRPQDAQIPNQPFHFYCECSDEDCMVRIELMLDAYSSIHKNRAQFVVKPGHETPKVERVVQDEETFYVVEKLSTPPEDVAKLHDTDVHNT